MHPSRRPAVIRGFSAASLATFVALAGHVSAGGSMPGPLGIVVPWMLSATACVLLAGRRLSVTRTSVSVALSQFLFHVLFVLGTLAPTNGGATHQGHVHGGPLLLPSGAVDAAAVAPDGMMWLGHAVAAFVTVVALHRGERLLLGLRTLAAQAALWLRRRLDPRPALVPARRRIRPATFFLDAPHRAPLLATLRGRGPPLLLAA